MNVSGFAYATVLGWLPLAAAAQPVGILVAGTLPDATVAVTIDQSTASYCLINARLMEGSGYFTDLGPQVSYYRRDTQTGPVAVSFLGLGHGTSVNGQPAAWDYYSAGVAILEFTSATAGTLTFIGNGNEVANAAFTPTFSQFAQSYDAAAHLLTTQFAITMGNCAVNFAGAYHD